MENRDVSELKGEKEDLEKKLREKEEMEQKYHDLLNSLKYVIQSGTTQQKETIPQVKVIDKLKTKGKGIPVAVSCNLKCHDFTQFFFQCSMSMLKKSCIRYSSLKIKRCLI